MESSSYEFPVDRLRPLTDASKTPLVLIACGSFSPITFLHLRMFEMARDHALMETDFQVVGGYLSAVSDEYKKPGLAPAIHRVNMCRLAVRKSSDWLMVDPWEALVQTEYSKTADVLDHFEEEINGKRRGIPVLDEDGNEVERRKARIMLLAGSDLIQTMSEPGVWDEKDLHHILGNFGCFIVERAESEIDQSIFSSSSVHSRSPLALYRDNIFMVSQLVRNDVSSTKVRLFLRKGMSVTYLIPTVVVKYIQRHNLYHARYHGELGGHSSGNNSSASLNARTPPQQPDLESALEDDDDDEVSENEAEESLSDLEALQKRIADEHRRMSTVEAGQTCANV